MDHTPFIVASYSISAVVLTWVAIAPVLRMRRLRRELAARYRREAARSQS